VSNDTQESRGEIDAFRAFKETHPGAVYLHKGDTYLVDTLDLGTNTVKISPSQVNYYTRVRGHKDTEILEIFDEKPVWGTFVCLGRLKVTDQVTGYEKRAIYTQKRLNIIPLDLPPLIFETEGLWFKIPSGVQQETDAGQRHFMGGIHAMEHAAIGIFPLLVMADRNDLGGISTPYHPQTAQAAVFIYDGIPGGAGLSRQAFQRAADLLAYTRKAIQNCPCETGCPSCVHSPKCGSGNRPIDKAAAVFLLERLKHAGRRPERRKAITVKEKESTRTVNASTAPSVPIGFGVLDIETQRSAQEVGGWHRADLMNVSCAVLYDSADDRFHEFLEDQVAELIERLKCFDTVIGFNIRRFDYRVLSAYSDIDFGEIPTLDILEEIHKHLGYRLSLDHLARVTLGVKKSADGLQALQWWKEGKVREIIDYCRQDVEITRDLYRYGQENRFLLFNNKAGNTVRIPVKW
jgi:DEAD/DEAH box helicase domain-containing protein